MGGVFKGKSSGTGNSELVQKAAGAADTAGLNQGAADLANPNTTLGKSTAPTVVTSLMSTSEPRSSATMQKNIMDFQDYASTRTRAGGAAVLAGNAGAANVGTKNLLGA